MASSTTSLRVSWGTVSYPSSRRRANSATFSLRVATIFCAVREPIPGMLCSSPRLPSSMAPATVDTEKTKARAALVGPRSSTAMNFSKKRLSCSLLKPTSMGRGWRSVT